MHLRHPNSVAHVRLLVRAPWKRYVVAAFFVAYYACSFKLWSDTVGQPHQWALDEQKRLIKEKAEAAKEKGLSFTSGQQDRKETELELDEESLPSQYMPGAFACVFIFLNIVVHVLFHLMCVWSVAFRALFLFQPARRVHPGSFVRVTPHANKGKADICLVQESEVTLNCHFKFQYQNFEFVEAGTEDPDLLGDVESPGIRLIQCPTNQPWRNYRDSKGLATSGQVELAQDKYGSNIFDLPKPTFMQLYQKQLISPLVIFQLFSAALWVMDTFWRYTCFTLGTILMFEASTVFQRLKSMATLRGMSTKSFNVFVYRCGKWEDRPIEELLPGDLISLHTKAEEQKQVAPLADGEKPPEKKETLVPCDCLIIDGSAIVNEATLTGESVPQMKDAMAHGSDPEILVDCFGTHRIHSLFSGTSLIQTTAPERPKTKNLADPNSPPDDGIICFVLRTGFNSSQGELMRMIEFSTESVGADVVETALQLAFLLVFALVAAGYVMKKASEDPTRPTYKTLIRCTQIITSVVPPSLPMQMAFAVNTALMSLLKTGIYCTEPFRVPYAGRVSHCFFDKTGTLTSDQMVAVGIVNAGGGDKAPKVAAVKDANTMACVVLAGCHSLIEVESKLLGDPIEVAALRSIAWSYQPSSSTASPSNWRAKEITIARQKEYMAGLKDDIESDKKEKEEVSKKIQDLEKSLKTDRVEAGKLTVAIKHRFHFSSDLQRMSTICKVTCATDKCQSGVYGLVKGSPEAIAKLLQEKPSWYDSAYKSMAEQGQRILALAYTRIVDTSDLGNKPREEVENHLTFAGFIAFKCETRKDSMLVIRSLQDSSHACVMLTGDAPLTALSVAVEVGIAQFSPNNALVLTEVGEDGLEWRPAITSGANGDKVEPVKFEAAGIRKLGESRDLIITGGPLERAWQQDTQTMQVQLSSVKIFARLSPFQKEQIIQAVRKSEKSYSFMCGDGGNDVGALKEADVGLALLSGFGNANVDAKNQEEQKADVGKAEDALEAVRKENQQKAQEIMQKSKVEMERKRKDLVSKQQEWIQEELEKRKARGEDVGVMAQFSAMKSVMGRLQTEMKKEQELQQKKHGTAFAAGAAKWAEGLDSMEDTPMVQLGDASTAAPFTTRTPSISSVVDIIRQGRCTLLSAVQQMQMMMLESMIAAYTMSTMSVDGTRPSEPQMMASGVFVGIASLAFSFARPLDRMHPVRPLSSVFHPANLFSMLGQLAIHLFCMVYIANLAKEVMGEEAVRDIIEFEKERNKRIEAMTEEEMSEWNWFSSVPFKNNLLNTCCWLVETAQQVSVIFVNYKGRPWMKGLLENQPLFLSLFVCIGMVAVCAWGVVPFLNSTLNLEVVPEELRMKVIWTLLASLVGTFIWDRLMVALCAPHIMAAQLEEAKATTWKDFLPLLQTAGMIVGGGLLFVSGNPLLWGGAFMMYRNWKKTTEAKASAST